jgi:hypothetical protein
MQKDKPIQTCYTNLSREEVARQKEANKYLPRVKYSPMNLGLEQKDLMSFDELISFFRTNQIKVRIGKDPGTITIPKDKQSFLTEIVTKNIKIHKPYLLKILTSNPESNITSLFSALLGETITIVPDRFIEIYDLYNGNVVYKYLEWEVVSLMTDVELINYHAIKKIFKCSFDYVNVFRKPFNGPVL